MFFLNRTACLGGWVQGLKFGDGHKVYNQQKVRVDMFMDIVNGIEKPPNITSILPLLTAINDTSYMYLQSEKLLWLTFDLNDEIPNYLIMDSYSELVDKKTMHKDGWSFCGCYSDFKQECFESGTLIDYGLLSIDKIYDSYDMFFNFIQQKWNIPIIFLHFPTTFDDREKYIKQGIAITEALGKLSTKYNIQNIHADEDCIEQKEDSPLNYHFGNKTIKNMVDKII